VYCGYERQVAVEGQGDWVEVSCAWLMIHAVWHSLFYRILMKGHSLSRSDLLGNTINLRLLSRMQCH
jgi:hypothetical protein